MTFKTEIQQDLFKDQEYEALLEKWIQYRQETEHLTRFESDKARRIERRIFAGVQCSGEKYYRAKIDSMEKKRWTR